MKDDFYRLALAGFDFLEEVWWAGCAPERESLRGATFDGVACGDLPAWFRMRKFQRVFESRIGELTGYHRPVRQNGLLDDWMVKPCPLCNPERGCLAFRVESAGTVREQNDQPEGWTLTYPCRIPVVRQLAGRLSERLVEVDDGLLLSRLAFRLFTGRPLTSYLVLERKARIPASKTRTPSGE